MANGKLLIVDRNVVFNREMAQLAGAAEVAADGSIVVAFNKLTDAIVGNVGIICRSTDLGRTWQDTNSRLRCEHYDEGSVHVALGMAREPGGRLMLPYSDVASARLSPDDHPRHMKNRPRPSIIRMVESMDHGQTWSDPRDIQLPGDFNCWYLYGKIRMLDNNRMVFPVCAQQTNDRFEPVRGGVHFGISQNGGKTWPQLRSIQLYGDDQLNETDMIILPDATWLTVSRTSNRQNRQLLSTCSSDEGVTWKPLKPTGIYGHSPSLLRMTHGRLYLAYRKIGEKPSLRNDRAGLGISWSDDNGQTWQGEITLDDPHGYRYEFEHETGMPCMLQLPDGRIIVVFYSYNPNLPFEPEDETWCEVCHFYKRYIAMNILEEI